MRGCVYIIWKVHVCVCVCFIHQENNLYFSYFTSPILFLLFPCRFNIILFFSVFLFPRMPFQLLPQIICFQLISITFDAVTILVKFRTILIKTYLSFLRKVSNYHISCPVLARVYQYLCIDHHRFLLPTEPS